MKVEMRLSRRKGTSQRVGGKGKGYLFNVYES